MRFEVRNFKSGIAPGFTLVEIVVGVGVFILIGLALAVFQRDFFNLNRLVEGGLSRSSEVRKVLKNFSAEARSASPSSTGGYAIESAQAGSFIFFADIDDDGLKERLRYFLDGSTLKKGVIKPSGSPLNYNLVNEALSSLVKDVTGPAQVFSYYNASYDGTGAALSQPVDVSAVRMVRIDIVVDPAGSKPPGPAAFSIQATIRNLRGQ